MNTVANNHHFTNDDLINGYEGLFAKHIEMTFGQYTGGDVELPFDSKILYQQLFNFEVFDISSVDEELRRLIYLTPNAYEILKSAFLELLKQFTSDLTARHSHQFIDIRKLVDRIAAYLDMLYDIYFEISRELPHGWSPRARRIPDELLAHIKDGSCTSTTLYTRFKGIPIERDGTFVMGDEHSLRFETEPRLRAALANGLGVAVLDCKGLDRSYRAIYNTECSDEHAIAFDHIAPMEKSVHQHHMRVEPNTITAVTIESGDEIIDARLIDISTRSAALYCRTSASQVLVKGAELRLHICLGGNNHIPSITLNTTANVKRVLNKYRKDPHAYRLSVEFELTLHDEDRLSSYVAARQSEILAELNSLTQG